MRDLITAVAAESQGSFSFKCLFLHLVVYPLYLIYF